MNLEIIIIDDNLKYDDPIVFELNEIYDTVNLFTDPTEGKNYVLENLSTPMVILLDLNFPSDENGHKVFEAIRAQDKLIPIILWTASNIEEIEKRNLVDFINNHALHFVKKTDDYENIIDMIGGAVRSLKLDLATAIEIWLEKQENQDEKFLLIDSKSYSASELIKEIRLKSKVGKGIEEDILSLTIELLFNHKEEVHV